MKKYNYKYRLIHKKELTEYEKNRKKTNINYRIAYSLRNRIRLALKGSPKITTTIKLLTCSIDKFKKHLQSKFIKGMTWNNYGKWHIDHIRPCASFDLSKPEEQRKCFHYTNLQPLWAVDNLKKGVN